MRCASNVAGPEPAVLLEDSDTASASPNVARQAVTVSADVVPVDDVTVDNVDSTDGKAADMILCRVLTVCRCPKSWKYYVAVRRPTYSRGSRSVAKTMCTVFSVITQSTMTV